MSKSRAQCLNEACNARLHSWLSTCDLAPTSSSRCTPWASSSYNDDRPLSCVNTFERPTEYKLPDGLEPQVKADPILSLRSYMYAVGVAALRSLSGDRTEPLIRFLLPLAH
ncbi:unnamed protein product [Peniophora sp. CBMAI 1063]|nr:unnamed protein product [Peniophora sp. CBMAI 1063]